MRRLVSGMVAGMAGTLVLSLSDALERALLRRAPVYAPHVMAARLTRLDSRKARHVGLRARWAYGTSLGVIYARSRLRSGVALGASIYVFELLVLPLIRATPPVRNWPRRELLLLAMHTCVYGIATELSLRAVLRHLRLGSA